MLKLLSTAFRKEIVLEGLKVALVVGVILNLINQWDALTHFDWDNVKWLKFGLTFCVPYLVATYSAVVTILKNEDFT